MPAQSPPAGPSCPETNPGRSADWPVLLSGAILAAGAIAVYFRSFSVPLLFDDRSSITDNATIRHLWPIASLFSPSSDAVVGGRPLLNYSFALNYAFGGMAVPGYHLVNLLIHVLAGWTLFALVRRTLLRPVLAKRFGSAATPLALAVGALWTWHPLLTESVTYLSQRAESLMGLFYLLTFYCFLRGAEADRKSDGRIWFALSVLACLAGVATKEVIVTAPLLLFLYDRTFVSGGFGAAWRRHWPVYLALAATWIPLGWFMIGLHQRGVGFGAGGIPWWAYGLTECRVVVKYLLLAFWPHPLVFDYGMYESPRLWEILPYALVLALLLVATAWALFRRPALGFAGAWFFLILAPASSIVPVAGQPMAENRLYLPLAGVVAFAVLGAFALAGRRSWPVLAAAAVGLGFAAGRRNEVYRSERALWNDTIAKNPTNARAHNDLGYVLEGLPGQLPAAIAQYREALRLRPDYAEAHNNLGDAWTKTPGQSDKAIAQYEEALRLKPDYPEAHYNLGAAWLSLPGRRNDAIAQYLEALRLRPNFAEAHNNLGNAWVTMPGRLKDAAIQYEEAVRLKPDYADAHYNLGGVWMVVPGHLDDAIAEYELALRLKPGFAEAHNNLGNAWSEKPGRLKDAIAQYEEALRLKPDFAEAHFGLAAVLLKMPGREAEARGHLEAVLRLQPKNLRARQLLAGMRGARP